MPWHPMDPRDPRNFVLVATMLDEDEDERAQAPRNDAPPRSGCGCLLVLAAFMFAALVTAVLR
jgi:hypothetical protein